MPTDPDNLVPFKRQRIRTVDARVDPDATAKLAQAAEATRAEPDLVTRATHAFSTILRHALGADGFDPHFSVMVAHPPSRGVHVTLPHFTASPAVVGNVAALASMLDSRAADAAEAEPAVQRTIALSNAIDDVVLAAEEMRDCDPGEYALAVKHDSIVAAVDRLRVLRDGPLAAPLAETLRRVQAGEALRDIKPDGAP